MHNGKNMLIKAIILSFTFLVGVFVMSAAWFMNSQTATASGLSVSVHKDLGLQISDDNSTWTSELTYPRATTTGTETTTIPISLPLVTSSDGINFKKPLLHMTTGEPTSNDKNTWNDATAGTDYIEKTIYFRSDKPMTVSLSKAEVTPCVSNDELETNPNSKSDYGDFSIDYIAAAARVGITSGSDTVVYDPNPNIELKNYGQYIPADNLTDRNIAIFTDDNCYYALTAKEDNSLSDIPISMNSTTHKGSPVPEQMFVIVKSGDNYTFESLKHSGMFLHYNSTDKKFDLSSTATSFTTENGSLKVSGEKVYLSYDGNSFVALEKETAPTTATVKMLTSEACDVAVNGTAEDHSSTVKTEFTDLKTASAVTLKKANGDTYYKGQIILRIWAEGTDRDALVPLMGGKFKTEIEFSGTVTAETTAPSTSQEG